MKNTNILENNPIVVVDVGAASGIDPRWKSFTEYYKGIMFEPDPREFSNLTKEWNKNLVVLNAALSDMYGSRKLHLCKKQHLTSIYKPNHEFLKHFPDEERYDVEKIITIKTDTLDNQLEQNKIDHVDFIKIDTQGHELPILKGSQKTLDNVIGLELEVEFAQIYQDQPLFHDVDSFVRSNGFDLFDLKRYYWKRKDGFENAVEKGQMIFADALYFKSPEKILEQGSASEQTIIRAISVYLVYGYDDLARSLLRQANENGMVSHETFSKSQQLIDSRNLKINTPYFSGKYHFKKIFENLVLLFSGGWYTGTRCTPW